MLEELNWEYILKMGSIHKLNSLLYHNLNSICPENIPEDTLRKLKINFKANVHKNLLLTGELIKVLKLFESNKVSAIPYKGPILASSVYGNIGFREFGDIDIYIDEKDVLKVREILLSNGYVPDFNIKPSKLIKYIKTQRDLVFYNKDNKIVLEIHWNFSNIFFYLPKNKGLWEKDTSIHINFYDLKILYPSVENMILILCLHNANHHWSRLLWICDISEIIESGEKINWIKLIKDSEELGIKRILLINLKLSEDLLNLNLPENVKTYFESDDLLNGIVDHYKRQIFQRQANQNKSLLKKSIISIKLRENIIYGIKDVIKSLTTPTVYEWKTLQVPTYLWFVYYLYRPFNLLWRYKWF